VNSGIELDDELVSETILTRVEKVLEPVDELLEDQID